MGVGVRRTASIAAAVLLLSVAGCSGGASAPSAAPSAATSPSPRSSAAAQDRDRQLAALFPAATERDRPGDPHWEQASAVGQHDIEGFTDRDSARPGARVRLYVSTRYPRYQVLAYRTGWYRGTRARLVWRSAPLPGRLQGAAVITGDRHTASAPWQPSLTLPTAQWPPGDYLLRLDAGPAATQHRFVPLTIRSPSVAGAVVLVNATTTWQAYNLWGGYSLYQGPDGAMRSRARAVSFDRPYAFGAGAADYLGNELPLVSLAERLGLRLAYLTDVDLHSDPHALDGARAVISLGHDEYWSPAMRRTVTAARDRGVNLAFLGANAVYRKIRFEASALGANRIEVNYKNATDPIGDPNQVTTQWGQPPDHNPGNSLVGTSYGCNVVKADMVAVDATSWLTRGIVRAGQRLPAMVGTEYDRVLRTPTTPHPIQVLFHSPLTCRGQADHSDAAYYSTRSGAGVFSSGTNVWVCALQAACADGYGGPADTATVVAITTRLLTVFGEGPAGARYPARDNTARYG